MNIKGNTDQIKKDKNKDIIGITKKKEKFLIRGILTSFKKSLTASANDCNKPQ